MRKGFFLLFELIIVLLLFSSVYLVSHSFHSSNHSASLLPDVACSDLLSVWLLGEDDLSSIAHEILPSSAVSFSTIPIFPQKLHSVACFAQRFQNGALESQYILIEW